MWSAQRDDEPTAVEPPIPSPSNYVTPEKSGVSKPLLVVVAVLALALIGTTTLWIRTSSSLSAERAQVASLQQENQRLDDAKSAFESAEAQRESAAAQVPDLRAVANKHFKGVVSVSGNADAVSITIQKNEVITAAVPLNRMLTELGFSSAVIDRMDKTRALDGTQNAEGKNCNVTWTYHPDDGLQMVFEADAPN
jgi:type II secretory pathway pseudopilin PulG